MTEFKFGNYVSAPMTENLFWQRVFNLWTMYHSITDDLVYKAMWKRKLEELMQKGFEK